MGKTESYKEYLSQPAKGNHFVQVYQDDGLLVEAVCHYASHELAPTEGVIIIATPAHREAIIAQLNSESVSWQDAYETGQYLFLDAKTLLSSFMIDGMPDEERAFAIISAIFDQMAQKYESVRGYGEMVNILWQAGNKPAAIALEGVWNILIKRYSFSLLCSYYVDNLDPAVYNGDIECLCASHTHLIPSQHSDVFDKAVSKAAENVMGVSLSGMMSSIAKFPHPTTIMPAAQASLLYISKTMPITTEFILNQVRIHLSKIGSNA